MMMGRTLYLQVKIQLISTRKRKANTSKDIVLIEHSWADSSDEQNPCETEAFQYVPDGTGAEHINIEVLPLIKIKFCRQRSLVYAAKKQIYRFS